MAKNLVINSEICDVRKVKEESLAAYESIKINSELLLTNERATALLHQYPVTINCENTADIEGDVQVRTVNGSDRILSTDTVPSCKQFLTVNGSLEIGPGTEKILENYVGMSINGSVIYPESLSGCLGRATVNGSTICYPDGAVVLDSSGVIDRVFALRAKNRLYWARKRLIFVDPQLEPQVLAAKGATFQAKEAILAESKVEELIDLIDERTDIIIVPDGTAVVRDDVVLDDVALSRYGRKLYILGDLKATEENRAALEAVEYLNIRGDVQVDESVKGLLLMKATEIGGDVKVARGRVICDHVVAKISRWLLEQEPKGIAVSDCATVKIDPDVPNELILERLTIEDCAIVKCSEEQADAVTAVSQDVAMIGPGEAGGIGDVIKAAVSAGADGLKGMLDTKVINSEQYIL